MVQAGDTLENPIGESITFVETAADSGGERLVMEVVYLPSDVRPPLHYHPRQNERFEVLTGEIVVRRDSEETTFVAGDSFTVPAGTVHQMVAGEAPETRLRWEVLPALDSESFFEAMWTLPEDRRPSPLRLAWILTRHRHEFRLASPAYWIQRIVFGTLALVARLTGQHRATQ
jgi:quercetin dioxygenase-like cupin family protein